MTLGGRVDWWRRHFLGAELALAVAVTAAAGLYLRLTGRGGAIDSVLFENRAATYGAIASVFGSLLGFVIATFAIVLGYSQHERLQAVRDSRHYQTLWRVFSHAVWALGLGTIAPIAALLFDRDARPLHWLGLLVFGAALLGLLRLVRCVWVLEHIVKIVTAPAASPRKAHSKDEVA